MYVFRAKNTLKLKPMAKRNFRRLGIRTPIIRIVMARKALALTSRIKFIMLIGISNATHLTYF